MNEDRKREIDKAFIKVANSPLVIPNDVKLRDEISLKPGAINHAFEPEETELDRKKLACYLHLKGCMPKRVCRIKYIHDKLGLPQVNVDCGRSNRTVKWEEIP